ncbi:MAG: hypothetical protein PHF58_10515, partial [Methylotenera sp.]|nr:hypothetical protein [Methylotenera sp.]
MTLNQLVNLISAHPTNTGFSKIGIKWVLQRHAEIEKCEVLELQARLATKKSQFSELSKIASAREFMFTQLAEYARECAEELDRIKEGLYPCDGNIDQQAENLR